MSIRLPDPIANTATEAYLAYKAGVLSEGDLKPKLYDPYIHLDAWLAYWAGLTTTYPVKNVGKNLFNKNSITTGFLNADGTLSSDVAYKTSDFIAVKPNTAYSKTYTASPRTKYFDSARQPLDATTYQDIPIGGSVGTFTTPANAAYVRFSFPVAGVNIDTTQLELGSAVTAYEPYSGEPEMLTDEEAYIAYLSGVTDTYPQEFRDPADIRVAAYLRYLISGRWGRPEYPVNNEEFYLSLMKTKFIPSGDPSSDIKIDGTAKAPFVDVKMYGNTTQQTYTGKNLLDMSSDTSHGVTGTVNADGTMTISGKANATGGFVVARLKTPISAGTYTMSISKALDYVINLSFASGVALKIEAGRTTATVTLSQEYSNTSLFMAMTSGVTYDDTFGIQVVQGSTPDYDFEPYVGGVPSPNPDYPQSVNTVTGLQTIEIAGKNLLNPNMLYPVGYSETIDGITYTMMEDGGIKMKGTTGDAASSFMFLGVSWGDETNQIPLDSSKAYMSSITRPSSAYRWYLRGLVNGAVTTLNSNLDSLEISNCSGITYAVVQVSANRTVDAVVYPQVELGSTVTSFTKYSKQTLPINLGKNLYQSIAVTEPNFGMTSEVLPDGRVRIHGKATSNSSNFLGYMATNLPAGTYTFSITGELPFRLLLRSDDNQNHWVLNAGQTKVTQTISNTLNTIWVWGYQLVSGTDYDITIGIQLEEGSTATPFAPYFTPIELCKLGDYQDYIYKDEGKWYLHKSIYKEVLDNTGAWTTGGENQAYIWRAPARPVVQPASSKTLADIMSPYFKVVAFSDIYYAREFGIAVPSDGQRICVSTMTDVATTKTWLGNNKPPIYYALITPTDTEITDQTLIDQLDALVNGGAEEGTTYIKVNATDPNLPALLVVEAPKYE